MGVAASGEVPKMKPKKTGKGGVGKRLVLPIPLDNTGRPIFPIELGPLTIHSLGEVRCMATYKWALQTKLSQVSMCIVDIVSMV